MEGEDDLQWQFLRLIRSTGAQGGQDVPLNNLHFIVHWWVSFGKNRTDTESSVAELLQKLDEAVRLDAKPAEKNNEGRTALHVSVMRKLPDKFIVTLTNHMEPADINQKDDSKRTALDYLLDQDDMSISSDVLQAFVERRADFTGGDGCTMRKCPLATLCRRRADGHFFLGTVISSLNPTTWETYKTCMLEEAIKTGSHTTVKLLLEKGADPNAEGKFLLHSAADANHENVAKVKALLSKGGCDANQKDQGGQTLLHKAAGGRPPRVEIMRLALHFKTDINKKDKKGDTALHKVATNYAGRNTEWKQSVDVMRRLLLHESIQPNIRNKKGLTPLQKLFEAKRNLPESLVLEWVQAKADFTGREGDTTSMASHPLNRSPLEMLATRKDGPKLFKALSVPLKNVILVDLELMLEAAVKTGTADMVELLLEKGAKANAGKGRLLLLAADSTVQAASKIKHLAKAGAVHRSDGKGYTALHVAAASCNTSDDVLKVCIKPGVLGLLPSVADKDENTPLHLAAMNCNPGSLDLVRHLAKQGNPNAKNLFDQSPLQLVLEGPKELRQIKLAFLLENGCQPNENDLKSFDGNAEEFEELFLSTQVIVKSQDPIKLLIVLGKYCQEKNSTEKKEQSTWKKAEWRRSLKWLTLNEKLEQEAILMIEELGNDVVLEGVMTNDDIKEVDSLKWHKLLANENIGRLLLQMFNGLVDAGHAEASGHWWQQFGKRANREKWYHFLDLIFILLLQSLLIPIYLLSFPLCCCYHCCCWQCDKDYFISILPLNPKKLPIVTFGGSLIGYVIFLGFLMARIILGDDEGEFSWLDWVILLYIVAMAAEELYQIITRGMAYCNVTNVLDVGLIILFIAFYAFRAIGSASDNLLALRVSEHVFAVAAALAFVRVLYYLQIHHRLGPIQISFGEITTEVVSFLVILSVFLLSFGIAISGVYNAGIYTDLYMSQSVALPEKFTGLWPSLQTLYWSLYGQIEYTELESPHREFLPEVTVGLILFAFWSLVSVIVLLNMLIAVISEAFDRVKNANAELVRHRAFSRIIREIRESPSFPLPINLFYLLILLLFTILDKVVFDDTCGFCKNGDGGKDLGSKTTITVANRMTAAYQKKKHEQEFDKTQSEMQQSLKQHSEQLTQQVAGQLETMRSRLQRQMTSQNKRVRKHLKRIPNAARVNQVYGAPDETDGMSLQSASDSDSDDTDDDLQDTDVRYERVNVNGNTISYTGTGRQPGVCQVLRSPISIDFTYYEVTIMDYGEVGAIGVGLAKRNYPLNQMPGWRVGSVAFHCDDGKLFHERGYGQRMATPAQQGDVIGCGVDVSSFDDDDSDDDYENDFKVTVFFTRNGDEIGRTKVTLPKSGLFPTLGLVSEGESVSINLDARWPPAERTDEDVTVHPGRAPRLTENSLHFNDDGDILSYKPTYQGGIGIFQDLNYPISEESNYFEVSILDLGIRGAIGIGVAPRNYPLDRMPGWDSGSVAYHCDDGVVFKGPTCGRSLYTPTDAGEVIGCGVKFIVGDTKRARVFFSRNAELFHESAVDIPPGGFFPTIGMMSPGEEVKIDTEAKWPPRSTPGTAEAVAVMASRSERVHVDDEFIEYVGDRYRNVGVFQSLSRPMNHEFSYYEVAVIDYGMYGTIAIGLAKNGYSLNRQPGWDEGSVAWHCDDGRLFQGVNRREDMKFPPAEEGDIIGCGIDFKRSRRIEEGNVAVFFTRNGVEFAHTNVAIPDGGLYPTIGMHSDGERIKLNLSVDWKQTSSLKTNRSLGTEIASSRVRVVGDKVAYVGDAYNHVGGVQLLSHPISNLSNYYEVKVVDAGERRTIGIGLAIRGYPLDCQPGWVPGSIAYHCDDGILYFDGEAYKDFLQPTTTARTNDLVGCGVKEKTKDGVSQLCVFFTHNRKVIGKEFFCKFRANDLYPCIGMHSGGEVVQVNLAASYQMGSTNQMGSKPGRNVQLFSRFERVRIDKKAVHYEPDEYESVGAVQVDRKMTKEFAYYEVKIINLGIEGAIGVGLARSDYPLDCEPGWVSGSVGFHCDDGKLFTGDGFGRQFSGDSKLDDVVGCGIDWSNSNDSTVAVFFTRNRVHLGQIEMSVPVGGFFPTVGMCSRGEAIEVIVNATVPPKKPPPLGFINPHSATVGMYSRGETIEANANATVPPKEFPPLGFINPHAATVGMYSRGETTEVNVNATVHMPPKEPPPLGFINPHAAEYHLETTTM